MRYTWARKTRAQNRKIIEISFYFERRFLPVKNVFSWCLFFEKKERGGLNKLDPCFELFHATNKLEHLRNL